MTVNELIKRLQKVVDRGEGDATVVLLDTRSGVSEEIESWDTIEVDFELSSGEILPLAYPIYAG